MMLLGTGRKKSWRAALFLCSFFVLTFFMGAFFRRESGEDQKFEQFAKSLFQAEAGTSSLTLHYTLANPEKMGITGQEPSLGVFLAEGEEVQKRCAELEKELKAFTEEKLSNENRIVRDHLLLSVHTRGKLAQYPYLEEPLSPSLGIQAQLPILLAEYAFYDKEDLVDYLKILKTIRPYFESILSFEREKADAGLFMSEESLNRVLDQCASFIRDPDSNYMQELFAEKLKELDLFTPKEVQELLQAHKSLLHTEVVPAYQLLIQGLEDLRGKTGENRGLASKKGGESYYLALLQNSTGCYWKLQRIEQRLTRQLAKDLREISGILNAHPGIQDHLESYEIKPLTTDEMLETLQMKMEKDFPSLSEKPHYEVRKVHPSMEQFLSPAFYLTPPLDIQSPNVIYINSALTGRGLAPFLTLAHEGFPGHLYQTLFSFSEEPLPVLSLFASGGYVEGWATYVESLAAMYGADLIDDPEGEEIARLEWLNRSVHLCIYSLIDIGIHAQNWDEKQVANYLQLFGIENEKAVREVYQYIVENPANYPKYYLGYLNFLDLREAEKKRLGNQFDLRRFHEKLLEIGPVSFPVLRKNLNPSS